MRIATAATERLWPSLVAGAALGALQAASFSPPLGAWWLQLLCLAALFAIVLPVAGRLVRPARSAGVTLAFGLGGFAAGLSWLHTSMHVFGGMPSALAVAAVLLFSLYLALFPAAAVWAALTWTSGARTKDDAPVATVRSALRVPAAIGATWGLGEFLRGWVFTGFPWLSIGYAHVDGPLGGLAPWAGVYGIGVVAAMLAAMLGAAARTLLSARAPADPPRGRTAAMLVIIAAAGVAAAALLGRIEWTRPYGAPVEVRLVQGNVEQQMKFDPMRTLRSMEDYTRLVEAGSARLTVLPETAWTLPWMTTPPPIAERIEAHARRSGGVIAIGMPLQQAAPMASGHVHYTNSVALIGAADPPSAEPGLPGPVRERYDKRHLVPFGEFVPPGFRWFVDLMKIPLGDFGRGSATQAPFAVAGQRFAFNICYEDLFGEELLPALRGPEPATVLVNVSNIAWFGDSHALPQHLAIARMRTLETGRPMLRATNTGVTASIDHRGRVEAMLPPYTQGALDVRVQGTEGLTPYARFGNGLAAGLMLALLIGARPARRGRAAGKR